MVAFQIAMERLTDGELAGLRGPNALAGLRGPNALTGLRGPNALTGQWRRLRRVTVTITACWIPAAVFAFDDRGLPDWAMFALLVAAAIGTSYLLIRLAQATSRTRRWLTELTLVQRPAG